MSEPRRVFSSHINWIHAGPEEGEFTVGFANGSEVVYSGVPGHIADRISSAPSIGEAVWSELRGGGYDFRYLKKAGGGGGRRGR